MTEPQPALVEQYIDEPKAGTLEEIRLNEERLGATIRDRRSLRMTIKPKEEDPPSGHGFQSDARDRYSQAYGQGSSPDNVTRMRQAFEQDQLRAGARAASATTS